MIKRSKLVYILGSAIIGIVSIIFIFAGLILSGVIDASSSKLVLVSASKQVVYDGRVLTCNEWEIADGSLKTGHTIEVAFTGQQTDVGESQNTFTVTILDQNGADVSSDYEIVCEPGTLSVGARPLTLQAGSAAKEYDGTPLRENSFEILSGELVETHLISADVFGEITDAGMTENLINATVRDAAGTDVTANYAITELSGTLTVTQRKLLLKSGSAVKMYDMTPLVMEEYTVEQGELAEGQTIVPDYLSELTEVDVIDNKFNVEIYTATNTKVTQNYDITYEYGVLEVYSKSIVIQTGTASKVYDGTPLTCSEWTLEDGTNVYSGHTLEVICTGVVGENANEAIGHVGTAENTAKCYVLDADGNDVTYNYDIEVKTQTLEITKLKILVDTAGAEKTYDGKPFSNTDYHSYTVNANTPLVTGDTITETEVKYKLDNTIDTFINATEGGVLNEIELTICNADGYDVTDCYSVGGTSGRLKILPVKVVITSGTTTGVSYSGTPLKNSNWSYVCYDKDDNVVDISQYGHYINGECTGSQTTAGSSLNTVDWQVYSQNTLSPVDSEVAANYECEEEFGKLEIVPKKITIHTYSVSKEYDGTALENPGYDTSSLPQLCLDHTLQVVCDARLEGKIEQVANTPKVTILDGKGNDVSSNYEVDTTKIGTLEIRQIEITIQTSSASKTYDGTPLYGNTDLQYNYVKDGELLEGHTLSQVILWGNSQTDAGVCENVASFARIVNQNNVDVTSYYNITYSYGALVVNKRPITILSGSDSKTYDGAELTCDEWKYASAREVLDTHEIVVRIVGTRTEVGESPNTIGDVYIYETSSGADVDVTDNYNVKTVEGSLIVIGKATYSALSSNDGGSSLADSNTTDRTRVVAKVKSDTTGLVYLKQKSEGNYTGSGWESASAYNQWLIDGQYGMDYLTGIALETASNAPQKARLQISMQEDVGYMLPYYLDNSLLTYTPQTSDVSYSGGIDFEYSMYYYPYSYQENGSISRLSAAYIDGANAYETYVKQNYLELPQTTEDYLLDIINAKGWNSLPISSSLILKVARYVQGAATYNLNYDQTIDASSDVIIAFLEQKEGVCRHFASAATALYRALGIPARYTVGFVANTVAGQYVDVTYAQAHAWVEVYVSGTGWVQIEATGSNSGVLGNSDESKALQIYPIDGQAKLYDGVALTAKSGDGSITGNNNFLSLLNENYTYAVEVEGSQTDVGKGTAIIKSFVLYDPDGNDVTDEFSIEKFTGTLHVYRYELTVISDSATQEYNGKALTADGYQVFGLISGHTASANVTGSQKEVGTSSNAITVTVTDASGQDVTDQYKISYEYGTLEVTKAEITLKTASASQARDINSTDTLTCHSAEIIGNLGTNTEVITFNRGSYLDLNCVGSCANIAYLTIEDENGNDVTANYSIKYVYGTLTVY